MPALPLSNTQLAEAAALKTLFKGWQRVRKEAGLPSSQEAAAELLGFGQSALAQYLNGRIPLNVEASIKFSGLLGVAISEFSLSLAGQASRVAESVASYSGVETNDATALARSQSIAALSMGTGLPPRLQAMVILEQLTDREAALLHRFQLASDAGKEHIETMSIAAEKDPLFVVHDKAKS